MQANDMTMAAVNKIIWLTDLWLIDSKYKEASARLRRINHGYSLSYYVYMDIRCHIMYTIVLYQIQLKPAPDKAGLKVQTMIPY